MIRNSSRSQQTRPDDPERFKRLRRQRALDTGPVADARRDKERRSNRERQRRFREQRRALSRETVPDGDEHGDREPIRETRQRAHESASVADCMETDGPQASSSRDLPLVEEQMVGVLDEDAVVIQSRLPNDDAQRERVLDSTRERMRRYRERQHVPLPDAHSMGDIVDGDAAPAPPYLPLHQQQAIHDFLDRLRVVGNDLHECPICFEKYHGMPLRGVVCARCHSEVMFSHLNVVAFPVTLMTSFFRGRIIVTMGQMMLILVMFPMSYAMCYRALLKWRKCSAASCRLASSCG